MTWAWLWRHPIELARAIRENWRIGREHGKRTARRGK